MGGAAWDGLLLVPAGAIVMGSPENEPAGTRMKLSVRWVLADGFWMAKYEWPRALWRGSRHRAAVDRHKLHPVNMVSQSKDTRDREIRPMNAAAQKLLPAGWEFAMPGEDQWEYAALRVQRPVVIRQRCKATAAPRKFCRQDRLRHR